MSFGAYLRHELRTSWVFFAVFLGIGVLLDLVVYQREIDWLERSLIALAVTLAYALFSAWRKMRNAQ